MQAFVSYLCVCLLSFKFSYLKDMHILINILTKKYVENRLAGDTNSLVSTYIEIYTDLKRLTRTLVSLWS